MSKPYTSIHDIPYKNHVVFSQIDKMIEFYRILSFSIFGFTTQGTKTIYNIDSYLYSSVQGTMESIKMILKNGRINDAYALLRKYHDSAITNIYTELFLKDNFSIENLVVLEIEKWLIGKTKMPNYSKKMLPLHP